MIKAGVSSVLFVKAYFEITKKTETAMAIITAVPIHHITTATSVNA